jgi:hypothetical protein
VRPRPSPTPLRATTRTAILEGAPPATCSERGDFGPEGTFDEVTIARVWGNSPSEVFIALREQRIQVAQTSVGYAITHVLVDDCGSWRVYWFDGQELARL